MNPLTVWQFVLVAWTLGLAVVSWLWKVGSDDLVTGMNKRESTLDSRESTLDSREAGLELYAGDLERWDTKQKSRKIGLDNYLGLADRMAKHDPVLFEKLEEFKDTEGWYVVPKDEFVGNEWKLEGNEHDYPSKEHEGL